ncbi:MAG: undecaprenyldiphospho-muramoylpentapeptide beta-N-acetylglucosaminyltransferase [Clostridiales bacterium]|jgi:UDP-N-acetylglucosamine--N-acetylmuramyl-(pentapeptide) pyrophosphoryl-undecaprenol N-acetylglucosamine transferase|nr:undecaprenyldiphospho-muramoylpentapeptide beta-N-acetylglucosaminyltransferase [Clostridiales bacterium]
MPNKIILLTGGGTAGHVVPNLALLPALRQFGFTAEYAGQSGGIEQRLAEEAGLRFHAVSAGKLRRYLSWKNISDVGRTLKGVADAVGVIRRARPVVVFSKGGFVSVPVVVAARLCGVPAVIHESDITPGLANRLAAPFASRFLVSWPETARDLGRKAVFTGAPIRAELLEGGRAAGLRFLGFSGAKPVLLVMGGSLGAAAVNVVVRRTLPSLTAEFDVAHVCGKGGTDASIRTVGYRQLEYIGAELADVYAAAAVCLSRAGAGACFELTAAAIPTVYMPLTKRQSRGDQILNAASLAARGYCEVADEDTAAPEEVVRRIRAVYADRDAYSERMRQTSAKPAETALRVVSHITQCAKKAKGG